MPLDEFKIKKETAERGVVILYLIGYLDAHTFEQLEEAINELFDARQYRIVVDLSAVEYISSAGAGVFIGALAESHEHKGNIVLLNPTQNICEVFDLLGLTQIFQIANTRSAALAFFST
ncbi:MAG: STAS domain-containing protein [Planctomycetota bacterium]